MSVRGSQIPLYFGAPSRQMLGWLHPGRGPVSRGAGVVICNPLGYEAICAHRALRCLAEALADAGFHALRFDYPGTGDSAGDSAAGGDAPRAGEWIEGIGAAIDELRARAGVTAVSLFGLRMGATLAAPAAASRGALGLALFGACLSGRHYVRELRAFRLLEGGDPKGDDAEAMPASGERASGDEDAAGFVLKKAAVAELCAISLLDLGARPAPRVLLLGRDDLPAAPALAQHLGALGAEVRALHRPGYAAMMQDAHRSVVPEACFAEVVSWLGEVHGARGGESASPRLGGIQTALAPVAGDPSIREEAMFFGEGKRLFGILTEPSGGGAMSGQAHRPAVILLNAGAVHRVGPNRMYVTLARAWAALGLTVLRMDVGGVGDSAPAAGHGPNEVYSRAAVADVVSAMRHLRAARGIERFVLGGICSGAYLAFHTALAGAPVVGTVLVNPQSFYWRPGDSLDLAPAKRHASVRRYRGAIARPDSWRRLARGDVDARRVLGDLVAHSAAVAGASLSPLLRALGARRDDLGADLTRLVDTGVDVLLVFSAGDPGQGHLALHAGRSLDRLRRRAGFRLEIIEGADHTFTPVRSQTVLRELLTSHLVERFVGPDRAGRAGGAERAA